MTDVLRAYLARRSIPMNSQAIGWGTASVVAILVRWLILWLYQGWLPIASVLLMFTIMAAFMCGRRAGWRDCWQETINFIDKTRNR